ncbi:MAG: PAS domain S-box protein [Nitrospirae bacterium]|nr:PAS domain S-box protein [Nitrospirota bacterium]MBF0541223.1 PAS domain S-box protein [Nitrospirota bacterium]
MSGNKISGRRTLQHAPKQFDRVLLIEDDKIDQMAFSRLVTIEGLKYDYKMVMSVTEAKQVLRVSRFDVIISDYMLGDGTALDIMDLTNGTPLIIITGMGNEEVAILAIRGGAYDYMVKDHERNYLKLLPVSIENAIEHYRAEKRLRLLEEAMMNANDAIIILEAEPTNLPGRRVLFVNEAFSQMTGYENDEIIGKTLNILQGPETNKVVLEKIRQGFDQRIPTRAEIINYKKDGSPFWVESNIVPFSNDKGWTVHWVSIQRDITERKLIEEAIQKAKDAAVEASQAKSEFLSTVSHELRTPLTSILGFVSVTKKKFEEIIIPDLKISSKKVEKTVNQVKGNLDIMYCESMRLTALINDVLDLAKIEAGSVEWKHETVELSEVFNTASEALSTLFDSKGIYLKSETGRKDFFLTGDRGALIQVATNLLSNALKFTDTGGVKYKITNVENFIECEVEDTGIGIPSDMLINIFEKFKQIGDTLTSKPKGTGLGLSISKEIIKHHNGSIWAESILGKGSKFIFRLPKNN